MNNNGRFYNNFTDFNVVSGNGIETKSILNGLVFTVHSIKLTVRSIKPAIHSIALARYYKGAYIVRLKSVNKVIQGS